MRGGGRLVWLVECMIVLFLYFWIILLQQQLNESIYIILVFNLRFPAKGGGRDNTIHTSYTYILVCKKGVSKQYGVLVNGVI